VAAVLFALARRHPLIIILDDLHWADSATINLLSYLGRHLVGSRILVIGTYQASLAAARHLFAPAIWRSAASGAAAPERPPRLASAAQAGWERHPLELVAHEIQRRFGEIRIDLDHSDNRYLLAALVDSEPNGLGAAFRETLYAYTAGNPLFTLALLSRMRANGSLVRDATGQWVEGLALDWKGLPSQVAAAIAECVARLPPAWQRILSIASVEGHEFTAEVVARVSGVAVSELIDALGSEYGLVYLHGLNHAGPQGRQRLSRYRFRHRLAQQYLYNRMDLAARTQMHEAVAQALAEIANAA
jgi:predicted ATPase